MKKKIMPLMIASILSTSSIAFANSTINPSAGSTPTIAGNISDNGIGATTNSIGATTNNMNMNTPRVGTTATNPITGTNAVTNRAATPNVNAAIGNTVATPTTPTNITNRATPNARTTTPAQGLYDATTNENTMQMNTPAQTPAVQRSGVRRPTVQTPITERAGINQMPTNLGDRETETLINQALSDGRISPQERKIILDQTNDMTNDTINEELVKFSGEFNDRTDTVTFVIKDENHNDILRFEGNSEDFAKFKGEFENTNKSLFFEGIQDGLNLSYRESNDDIQDNVDPRNLTGRRLPGQTGMNEIERLATQNSGINNRDNMQNLDNNALRNLENNTPQNLNNNATQNLNNNALRNLENNTPQNLNNNVTQSTNVAPAITRR